MTRWGSRSAGSPTTSTSGIVARPRAVRIRSTSACWRGVDLVALGDHRLERGGRGQRAGHVLEAAGPLVDPVVAGERVAPAGALADQQHADARGAAPLVRRPRRDRPAAGSGSRPIEAQASMNSGTSPISSTTPRPADRARPRGWPPARRLRRPAPGRQQRGSDGRRAPLDPSGPPAIAADVPGDTSSAACSTAECSTAECSSRRPARDAAGQQPEQAPVHRVGARARERHLVGPHRQRRRPRPRGRCRAAAGRSRPGRAGAAGRRTPCRAPPAAPRGRQGAGPRRRRGRGRRRAAVRARPASSHGRTYRAHLPPTSAGRVPVVCGCCPSCS